MRILQVIPHYLPAYGFGGPLHVAHSLGVVFARQGHTVTVCTTNLATGNSELDVPVDRETMIDGIHVYYEAVPFSRKWGFSPGLWQRTKLEIARSDFIFVHAHYQFANWAGAFLSRRIGKPYVIFPHSSLRKEAINHKNAWPKRFYINFFERENLRKATFLAFNAPEEKEDSLFSEQGRVIPNGIAISDFADIPPINTFRNQYPILKEQTLFLFLGRLDILQKGLDLLIPAFAQATGINPQIHLVLAGPDEDNALVILKELVHRFGIDQFVTFTGLISGREKLAALRDADVFVLTSRFEGSSIALLEALYMGLPVLVSDSVGMCREIALEGAGRVVPLDTAAIANSLIQLANDDVRTSMRRKGTDLIMRKYTWDMIAVDLLAEIDQILAV